MPNQKKAVKKTEQVVESKPKTFNAFVIHINEKNELTVLKGEKPERVVLAHVELPRYDKKQDKEEMFAYECGEFLRKKLIGKNVKFEVTNETANGIVPVIPTVGSENIVISLLSLGYAVLREGKKRSPDFEPYEKAQEQAKAEKKGVHNENGQKLCKKRPAEPKMTTKDLDFYMNKELKGFIKRVEAPASFVIEMEDRKFFRMQLEGVNQHAPYIVEEGKHKLDKIATEAVRFVEKVFGLKDCSVKIVENGKKVRGTIQVGGKDVAETLLANGYVTLSIRGDSPLKEKYEQAEKKAQNEKKGRFADEDVLKAIQEKKEKKEKAVGDRIKNAKIVTGFVKHIGKFVRIEKEDKTEVEIRLASVRPVYKKDDAKFNQNVEIRMRECIRKQIVGKKVEAKHAYTAVFKRDDKEIKEEYYDLYANGKNVALQLLREGICQLDNKSKDELKQSFDYQQLKQVQTKEFKVIPVTEYGASNIANVKDAFLDQAVYTCAIEKVISLTKYLIYIPSKECTLTVNVKNIRVPKGEECRQFVNKARDILTRMILYQDATVTFREFFNGLMFGEVNVKSTGDVNAFLTERGYAIPTGNIVLSAEVEEMKKNKLNIYEFDVEKAPKEEKKEEEKKPKRFTEVKFGPAEKVFLTGYDGENVYYYMTKEETAFIEAMSAEIKAIKRTKYELKQGKGYAVELKGLMYRAEVLSMASGANLVKCVDTGATIIVGKNRIRSIPEEIAKREVKVLSKKLIAIKPLSTKDSCYKAMLEAAIEYYNKEASLFICNDEAKVVIGDVCFNVFLVSQGLSLLDRRFADKGEFGTQLREAEAKARDEHLNAWQFGEIFDEDDKEKN